MKSPMYKIIFSLLFILAGSVSGASSDCSAAPSSGSKAGVGITSFGVIGLSVYADVSEYNFLQAAIGFSRGGKLCSHC